MVAEGSSIATNGTPGFQALVNSVCIRLQMELKGRGIALRARHTPPPGQAVRNVHALMPLETGTEDKLVGSLLRDLSKFKAITSYPAQAPPGGIEDGAVVAYEGLIIRGLLGYDMVGSRYLVRFDTYVTGESHDGLSMAEGNGDAGSNRPGNGTLGETEPVSPE